MVLAMACGYVGTFVPCSLSFIVVLHVLKADWADVSKVHVCCGEYRDSMHMYTLCRLSVWACALG